MTVTRFPVDGEPIEHEARRAYDAAYQAAYLYGSDNQLATLNEFDDCLTALAEGKPRAREHDAYTDAKVQLLELLREELQFVGPPRAKPDGPHFGRRPRVCASTALTKN